jgi:menaquinol-cytochrome c reductase iron-sulfur subunit
MDQHVNPEPNGYAAAADPIGRRRFLRWASGIGAGLSALLVGIPALTAFLSPGFTRRSKRDWIKVADDVSTLDVGTPIKVDFVEASRDAWVESRALRTVWLYTEDGETFTAYSGTCTHLGCSFGFDKDKSLFVCPCHHGVFDPKSGAVLSGPPPRPLDTLPVRVENGEVHVRYETFRTGIAAKVVA